MGVLFHLIVGLLIANIITIIINSFHEHSQCADFDSFWDYWNPIIECLKRLHGFYLFLFIAASKTFMSTLGKWVSFLIE